MIYCVFTHRCRVQSERSWGTVTRADESVLSPGRCFRSDVRGRAGSYIVRTRHSKVTR